LVGVKKSVDHFTPVDRYYRLVDVFLGYRAAIVTRDAIARLIDL
jgi:hypothetical protein